MTKWLGAALLVVLPVVGLAGEPKVREESGDVKLLDAWLAAQNAGDFAAYSALYGERFFGIRRSGTQAMKLDRAGWLKDREKMFAKKMTVAAHDVAYQRSHRGTVVTFEQSWSSGTYSDVGPKRMRLSQDRKTGAWKIAEEELVYSIKGTRPSKNVALLWKATDAEPIGEIDAIRAPGMTFRTHGAHPRMVEDGDVLKLKKGSVVVGVCPPSRWTEVTRFFQAINPGFTTVEVAAKETACPDLLTDGGEDDRIEWTWAGLETLAAKTGTITALLWTGSGMDDGGDGREYEETAVLVLLRDKKGVLVDAKMLEGPSDFTAVDSFKTAGGAIVLTEIYVDEPCDGSTDHEIRRIRLERRITAGPEGLVVDEEEETIETDNCTKADEYGPPDGYDEEGLEEDGGD